MTITQSIILGIIQGLTEFIPVSSSGHLVLTPYLFGWSLNPEEVFIFDVLVQVATLAAVIGYFWHDLYAIVKAAVQGLWKKRPFDDAQARLGWYLILATIPAGLAFLLFDETFEQAFQSPLATALFLLFTAALLFTAEWLGKRTRDFESIGWLDALVVGIFQILAIFPGVSRSGATITGGMVRGLNRASAARFSFLISTPVMLAGGAYALYELFKIPDFARLLPTFAAGFVAAAVVGYLAIRWLLGYLSKRPLYVFAIYCVIFGLFNLILFYN
ncbi:MAG: undecaprenyl-diphosphatase UppP [Chloroflexota bacterium]